MTKQELLIAEMTIGDGYIGRKILTICHCKKQYEYLKWKRELLIENGIECSKIKKFDNNGFEAYSFHTKSYDWIGKLRKKIYTPTKKYSVDVLKEFDALGLAIWYYDDGGLSQKKKNGRIHANDLMLNTGMSKEDNQTYIEYFKNYWDINFTQVKNHNCYRLRCGTKEARKFISIIDDYIIPCMSHKIAIKNNNLSA